MKTLAVDFVNLVEFKSRLGLERREREHLLIRPSDATGKRWEHYEPGSPEKDWHDDWAVANCAFQVFLEN